MQLEISLRLEIFVMFGHFFLCVVRDQQTG